MNDGHWLALGAVAGAAALGIARRRGSRATEEDRTVWFPWSRSSLVPGYPPIGEPEARGALYVSANRTLTRVTVEHGTLVDPRVHVALMHLAEKHPTLAEAELSVDNTPRGFTVAAALDAGWRDPTTSRLPRLFHGTSAALLPAILAHGLRPRGASGVAPTHAGVGQDRPSRPDRVYLTTFDAMGPARFASLDAVRKHGGERLVLEVDPRGLDRSLLDADEDADLRPYARHWTQPMVEWPAWAQCLARMGTVAYRGTVGAGYVRVWQRGDPAPGGPR